MNMKRIRIVVIIVMLGSLAAGAAVRHALFPRPDELSVLSTLMPDTVFQRKASLPVPHYPATNTDVVAFNSHDITPGIKGYAGAIEVLLSVDAKGTITEIAILWHRETLNYVRSMLERSYLTQFIGKNVSDDFEPGRDIDAISRATVSVKALCDTVRESSRTVAAQVQGIPIEEKTSSRRPHAKDFLWVLYPLLFLCALLLWYVSRQRPWLRRSRDAVMVISILITGILLSTPFSILQIYNLLLGRLSGSWLLFVLMISTGVSVIVAGRMYCGWLCPYGALCEIMSRLRLRQWDVPVQQDLAYRRIKYWLLCLLSAAVLISGALALGNIEPYVTLFSFSGNALTWGIVIAGLLGSLRVGRIWCRYFCPAGALLGLLSALSLNTRGYPGAGACPMGNRAGHSVEDSSAQPSGHVSECIQCNRCRGRGAV